MLSDVKTLVIANHKGGVTKSFTAYFLAQLLASDNHAKITRYDYQRTAANTLVVDLDFQSNLSRAILKGKYESIDGGVFQAISKQDATEYIIATDNPHLFLLPGTSDLAKFDDIFATQLSKLANSFKLLENALKKVVNELDIKFIVIDTSPALSKLLLQGLNVSFGNSTDVLIPFALDDFGKQSIDNIAETLAAVKMTNEHLKILGLLPVLLDNVAKRDKDILIEVREEYGELLLDSKIHRKNDIKNLLEQGFSEVYAKDRKALNMYYELLKELKERI